jgi:hypothetical protein
MMGFRAATAAIALFALGLQFFLMVGAPTLPKLGQVIINFFSYFTIDTNALVTLSLLFTIVNPVSGLGRLFGKRSARTVIAGYSAVVSLVYFFLLSERGVQGSWGLLANRLLHYVVPAMVMIDWLLFDCKGRAPWTTITASLVIPVLYGSWTLIHGAATGWYPYWFLNVARIGYASVLVRFCLFLCVFAAMALALVLLDRLIAAMKR